MGKHIQLNDDKFLTKAFSRSASVDGATVDGTAESASLDSANIDWREHYGQLTGAFAGSKARRLRASMAEHHGAPKASDVDAVYFVEPRTGRQVHGALVSVDIDGNGRIAIGDGTYAIVGPNEIQRYENPMQRKAAAEAVSRVLGEIDAARTDLHVTSEPSDAGQGEYILSFGYSYNYGEPTKRDLEKFARTMYEFDEIVDIDTTLPGKAAMIVTLPDLEKRAADDAGFDLERAANMDHAADMQSRSTSALEEVLDPESLGVRDMGVRDMGDDEDEDDDGHLPHSAGREFERVQKRKPGKTTTTKADFHKHGPKTAAGVMDWLRKTTSPTSAPNVDASSVKMDELAAWTVKNNKDMTRRILELYITGGGGTALAKNFADAGAAGRTVVEIPLLVKTVLEAFPAGRKNEFIAAAVKSGFAPSGAQQQQQPAQQQQQPAQQTQNEGDPNAAQPQDVGVKPIRRTMEADPRSQKTAGRRKVGKSDWRTKVELAGTTNTDAKQKAGDWQMPGKLYESMKLTISSRRGNWVIGKVEWNPKFAPEELPDHALKMSAQTFVHTYTTTYNRLHGAVSSVEVTSLDRKKGLAKIRFYADTAGPLPDEVVEPDDD